jgi:mannosidase alpha-like ER degradation enhancer 2
MKNKSVPAAGDPAARYRRNIGAGSAGIVARGADAVSDAESAKLAERVKAETRHAWQGYKRYAWGHDALKPLSKAPHDWYAQSLLMTPVDALDTLILMAWTKRPRSARTDRHAPVVRHDMEVQNFEVTIRLLGGLLSGYQLTGDERLLKLADDLGTRLLPVFDSPTGMPYRYVNLRTGKVRDKVSNPPRPARC